MSWKVLYKVKMASVDHLTGDESMYALAVDANNKGATRSPYGEYVSYEIFEKHASVDVSIYIVKGGHGDVENYRLFIEVDSLEDQVPDGLFGSKDEDGNPVTWESWCLPNFNPVTIRGKFYINTSANTGSLPKFSELEPVFDSLYDVNTMPKEEEPLDV